MVERIALVTGANRGIGYEVVRQLASKGVKVILAARDEKIGKAACIEIAKTARGVDFHQLDVNDEASIKKCVAFIEKKYGRLDILVNNAGILLDLNDHGLDVSIEKIRETMETNTFGALRVSRACIPLMKKKKYGRVVNISSCMGQLSSMNEMDTEFCLAYRMSKTALNVVTRVLAGELQPFNICINSMCPGWVRTRMGGEEAERSVEKGAETIVWLALNEDKNQTGLFFKDKAPIPW